jgi:large subunit ribosomal protein L9
VAERVQGLSVVIIRSAGEGGGLYGSVSARDVAEACTASGLSISRQQVLLEQPIKTVGLTAVRVELHPEVHLPVTVNVARSPEEAEKQARGEEIAREEELTLEDELRAELGAASDDRG